MGMQMREPVRDLLLSERTLGGRADDGFNHHDEMASDSVLLERAMQRLEQQARVLAFFEEKWLTAQNDVEVLMNSQARLKDRLARLTERAKHLYRTAIHDEVTGLLNRRMLINRLGHAIVQAERSNKKIGIVFMALNNFAAINSLHGAEVADQGLQQLSRRLEGCVRGGDTVSRYGRDEFVILLPEVQRPRNTETVLEKLRGKLAEPILVNQRVIRFSADFGVAIYPNDARHPHELVKCADVAMYKARSAKAQR